MKMFRLMTYALTLMFLMSVTMAPGWAAEDRRDGSWQNKSQTVEKRDRDDRNKWIDRSDRGKRNAVERNDRGKRRFERGDLRQPGKNLKRVEHGRTMVPQNREVRRDRKHGWKEGYVLDRRYGHNHYYPPHGHVVRRLPHGYRTYHYHGGSYYYMHGIWYRHSGVSFVVVTPPLGIVVPVLPSYYTTVWVGGMPYYYAGGVYYAWRPAMQGYVVSEAPAESSVETEQADSGQFYVYPKQGQSPDQQARDRYECHRWSADQTGFDPSQPKSDMAASELASKRSEYRRAIMACLDARGYSVK